MRTNSPSILNRVGLLAGTAALALALGLGSHAMAQTHGSGGSGHDSGASHESGAGHDSGSGHEGGSGGKKMGKGASGERGGGRGGSLRDVFKEMEAEAAEESGHGGGHDSASGGKKVQAGKKAAGGGATADKGKKGGKPATEAAEGEEEDSDRPEWAGTQGKEGKPGRGDQVVSGTKKGTLYGDMYVLLRDENGVPILSPEGFVQPIDADGNPIPLDAEGAPINPELAMEVEIGRMNVGRSPKFVLSTRYEEALLAINAADEVTVDAAGRLTLITNDDPATADVNEASVKTIDAPLENLALYVELMNTGTLTGVDSDTVFSADLQNLIDGTFTPDDLVEAATLFAAAADKTGTILVDNVVYMNSILDITGSLADPLDPTNTTEYVNYSEFTYDRSDTYGDVTANVLVYVPDPDGDGPLTESWVPQEVNIYTAVFGGAEDGIATEDAAGFAQAADDALQVIEFIHEYALPEAPVTN